MLSAVLPPIPDDDDERVAALEQLQILDTPPEPAFNDVVRVVADLCGVPFALISLIGRHRQWFKAKKGFDAVEVPRNQSFCAHLVSLRSRLEVLDPAGDSRFSFNPAVAGSPGIRYYAGLPLMTAQGHVIGSICAVDTVAHQPLSRRQWEVMAVLARGVMALIESGAQSRRLRLLQHRVDALEADQQNIVEVLSHDFVEPLRSISSHLRLVERREGRKMGRGSAELFAFAVSNALRMGGMLDRLLAYLQFGQNELQPEACCVNELMSTAWQSLHTDRLYPTATLSLGKLPTLCVDPSQCLVLFRQLLDNALRFVPEGRDPRVQVSAITESDQVTLQIEDNGIGIRADEAHHFFRLFSHGAARESGGGNGLTLARRIMMRHGGLLRLKPRGGGVPGTLVALQFPV